MQIKQLQEELTLIGDLEGLTQAYEEISVIRMQQIRQAVIATRSFLSKMNAIFFDVKTSYKTQIEHLMKKNHSKEITFSTIPNNGKSIFVFLSANAKLYGDIISKTFHTFYNDSQQSQADIVIVGSLGKSLYDETKKGKPYTYFKIPDGTVSMEDLEPILTYISSYQTVKVFYGKFENIISQKPQATVVSGQQEFADQPEPTNESFQFFYEPSLETILHFFETQVFSSLFQQTIHENELARYASRITAMEEAVRNIHTKKIALTQQEKRQQQIFADMRQLSAFSGMSLWRKKNL